MSLPGRLGLRLASPVIVGGRIFVPLVRMLSVFHARGVIAHCTPVALLIGEGGGWSFVPLEDGIGQEILSDLELPPNASDKKSGTTGLE